MVHKIISATENIAIKYGLNFRMDYIYDFKGNKKYVAVELYYNDYDMSIKHYFDLEILNNVKCLEGANELINRTLEKMARELYTHFGEK